MVCRFCFPKASPLWEAFSPLLCARPAALDHEAVLIVSAVGVNESGLIVGVEEILLAQSLDLVVDGIQQRLIALADGGGNRVLTGCRQCSRGSGWQTR